LHVKINSEYINFYNTKINKYKFVIKEENKTKKSTKYIYCKEQFIMETKENEGFIYCLDNYDNNFICKNNKGIYFQIQCNLVNTFNSGIQNISFNELKKINETEDFINSTEIKIGNMTKNNYDEKIRLILEIFDKIIKNCKNNESELFKNIEDLIKNDILNIRNFIPPNDTLILNQKIKYNSQIKAQAEESVVKIDKDIYNIITQSKNLKKKYEEYKIKLNKIHIDNIFNKDYSLKKLNKEESLKYKFDLKEINKNIILDYTPIIYYDNKENKIKCIYQEINYNTDIFIYDYYKYVEINILSNLNYNTNIEIESSKLDSIKLIKNQFKSNSISKIQINPNKKDKVENKIVSYDFNLVLKNLSKKIFDIKCLINNYFSKLYILLSCQEYELIYDENQKLFMFKDMKCLYENEEINVKCIPKIESVNILPKICLTSDKEDNNESKPDIRITNNNILFSINSSKEKTSKLHFIAEIYFTNEFSVKILFNTQIKKRDCKFLYYDYNKNNFINENPFLYLNEYILRENNEIIYDQYLLLINESNKRNSYKIKIINEFMGISLLNNGNELDGLIDKEKIIKLSFKINKDFIPLLKDNCQIGIELNMNNIIKRSYIEISSYLIDEQIIKTCYLINPGNNFIELNNVSYSELKDKSILLYNGFMKNLYCEIDYKEYKILNLSDKSISNSTFCFDPLSNRVEIGSLENYNFKDKKQRIKIFLYGIINNSFEWFPLAHNFKSIFLNWYRIYKNGDFEKNIQFIIGNYRNEYNSIEKNNISFSNII